MRYVNCVAKRELSYIEKRDRLSFVLIVWCIEEPRRCVRDR